MLADCLRLPIYHAVPAVNDERAAALAAEDGGLRSLTAGLRRDAGSAGNPAQDPKRIPTMTSPNDSTKITATCVPDEEWLSTVTRHFGGYQLAVEEAVHGWLQEVSEDYRGPWRTYELSNGGLYMAPVLESAQIRVASNGYRGRLSGDAAGVLISLFALNHLFLQFHNDTLARHFVQLMELAAQHAEASAIVWATN